MQVKNKETTREKQTEKMETQNKQNTPHYNIRSGQNHRNGQNKYWPQNTGLQDCIQSSFELVEREAFQTTSVQWNKEKQKRTEKAKINKQTDKLHLALLNAAVVNHL